MGTIGYFRRDGTVTTLQKRDAVDIMRDAGADPWFGLRRPRIKFETTTTEGKLPSSPHLVVVRFENGSVMFSGNGPQTMDQLTLALEAELDRYWTERKANGLEDPAPISQYYWLKDPRFNLSSPRKPIDGSYDDIHVFDHRKQFDWHGDWVEHNTFVRPQGR